MQEKKGMMGRAGVKVSALHADPCRGSHHEEDTDRYRNTNQQSVGASSSRSPRSISFHLISPIHLIAYLILMLTRSKKKKSLHAHSFIMMPVMIQMIMRSLFVSGQNCFGGIETFEKVSMTDFDESFSPAGILLQQTDTALTRDCINLCKQQPSCLSFGLDYTKFRCAAYSINATGRRQNLISTNTTNFFEKVCYRGITRDEYEKLCGIERLWSFERVQGAYLDGFEKVQLNNVASRSECAKACLMENSFACRSADYDEVLRICRLSQDDRRTQPQAFKFMPGSSREYIENQCAAPGPSTCLYETKRDVGVITMDSLVFATNIEDCQFKCDKEHTFNCRSYSIEDKRCFLSGDDRVSLSLSGMPIKYGSLYGEKKCVTEHCLNGIFTYEKITGYAMRSAITSSIRIKNPGSLGITEECRESCDDSMIQCPAFAVNYQTSRCEKLDRNTQGKTMDLNPVEGESIFEKVCLRIPDITNSMCRDKFWAFERVIGHEMIPSVYRKTYNFVQSRRDCQEYCLHEKEFTCRSAVYSEETTDCKLTSEDRRTRPHAYVRNNNVKVSYLENQCIRDHSHCPFVEHNNGYPTYTDIVMRDDVTTTESCEKMCNENRRFLCRSFAFYSSNSQCFLSGDDRASAGSTATQSRPGMSYYERKCETGSSLNGSATHNSEDMESHSLTDGNREPTAVETNAPSENSGENASAGGPSARPSQPSSTETPPDSPSMNVPPASSFPPGTSYPSPTMTSTSKSRDTDGMVIRPFPLKCGPNSKFTFERVPNFEPVGGYLNLLFTDNNSPGIVPECTNRCNSNVRCRAFIVDYTAGSCFGIFDNSSIGKFDLRLAIGKDYFEGFCVPNHLTCGKLWHFDRIVDQATIGSQPKQVIRYISKTECKIKCLEEWRFPCASASFDGHLNECKLYDVDRHTGSVSLAFTKGIDYMENQCSFNPRSCIFLPYERDVAMVSVTKSIRGSSSIQCEQECSSSFEFNCRSFTYIDQSSIPGANLCLLSSDSKKSSQKGSTSFRPRALHGERDCTGQHGPARSMNGKAVPTTFPAGREGRIQYDGGAGMRQPDRTSYNRNPYYSMYNSYPTTAPSNPQYPPNAGSYGSAMYPSQGSSSLYSGSRYPSSNSMTGNGYGQILPVPGNGYGMSNYPSSSHGSYPNSYSNPLFPMHGYSQSSPSPPPAQSLPYGSYVEFEKAEGLDGDHSCSYHQYTFEKTFGYDMRYARKDRSRIPSRLGLAIQCQDECLRRRFKCNAFVIEYGNMQTCYFLEESAGENRRILQKVPEVAYYEKICLKERTCGKLWTFERVIGYDFEETSEKEIPAVPTRGECQDYCLGEKSFSCKSVTYNYKSKICKLFTETRRSRPQLFKASLEDVDYMENHCAKEPPTCQYKDHNDMYFPFVDRLTNAFSLSDCQRQCDGERLFSCRAVAFETFARECALYSEDTSSAKTVVGSHYQTITPSASTVTTAPVDLVASSSTASTTTTAFPVDHVPLFGRQAILQPRRHTIYSEKGSCEQVTVQCTQQDMLLTMNFDTPFSGRVYAKGNPSQCYVLGTGSTQLQFAISLGSKCGTRPEGEKNFANEVVIQQHPVIMTDSDRTIRVLCTFESIDQTVTLMSPNSDKPGIDVHKKSYLYSNENSPQQEGTGVPSARTRVEQAIPSVVANSAPPPSVIMRILDRTGKDAQVVGLGDELTLQIELRDPSSAFGLFARNLYARSSNGESLFLLDNTGCPTDPVIFPALQLNPMGTKALSTNFKAFRFPSSGIVNFEVQVRFCQDKCEPVKCPGSANSYAISESYGRRRRRRSPKLIEFPESVSTISTTTPEPEYEMEEHEDEQRMTRKAPTQVPLYDDLANGSMTDELKVNRSALFANEEEESGEQEEGEMNNEVRQSTPPAVPSSGEIMHAPKADKLMMNESSSPSSPSSSLSASHSQSSPHSVLMHAAAGMPSPDHVPQPLTGPYSYPQNYMSSYSPPGAGQQQQQQQQQGPGGHYSNPYASSSNYYASQSMPGYHPGSGYGPIGTTGNNGMYAPSNGPYSPYHHQQQPSSSSSSAGAAGILNSSPWNQPPPPPLSSSSSSSTGSGGYLPYDQQHRFPFSNDSGWPFFTGMSGSSGLSRLSLPVPSNPSSTSSQSQSSSSSSPTSSQVEKPLLVHSSRPLPSTEKGKFRPPRPLSRPKDQRPGSAGSTISPMDTLRTTIVVGDEQQDGSVTDSSSHWPEKRSTKSGLHANCNTGPAILYTAIIVTLLHVGIILGGYFYYRRFFTYSSSKALKLFSTPSFSTENIAIASSGSNASARDFYSTSRHQPFTHYNSSSNDVGGGGGGGGGTADGHHNHHHVEHHHAKPVSSHRLVGKSEAPAAPAGPQSHKATSSNSNSKTSISIGSPHGSNYHLLNAAASNSNVFYGTGNVVSQQQQPLSSSSSAATAASNHHREHNNHNTIFNNNKNTSNVSSSNKHASSSSGDRSNGRTFTAFYSGIYGSSSPSP